jgi:hypothetical protein
MGRDLSGDYAHRKIAGIAMLHRLIDETRRQRVHFVGDECDQH